MATTAVLNLKINTKQFEQAERKVSSGMNRIKVNSLAVVAAIGAVGKALQVSIKNFMAQEDAVNAVASSLANAGDDVRKILPDLAKFASEMQKQTVFGDELILSQIAYGRNLGITSDRLKESTVAAIGLSSKLRIDLKTAFGLVGRAAGGNTQLLSRYNIFLREGSSDQEKFNELLRIGGDSFKLATDEAKTNSGQLKQAQNNWGDLTEKVGEFAVQTLKLPKILDILNKGFSSLSDIWTGAITIAKQLANIITKNLTIAFVSLQATIQKTAIRVETFFKNTYDSARKTISLIQGDADKAFAIQKRIEIRGRISEDAITGLDETKTKDILSVSNEIALRNKKLAEDYRKEIEKSESGVSSIVQGAIDRFQDQVATAQGVGGQEDDTTTPQRRQQQFAGAFEKGSVEAYSVEKSSQGNKTERQQLDVLRKIEKKDPVQITNNGII